MNDPALAELPLIRDRESPDLWLQKNLEAEYVSDQFLKVWLRATPEHEAVTVLNAHLVSFHHELIEQLQQDRQLRLHELESAAFAMSDRCTLRVFRICVGCE